MDRAVKHGDLGAAHCHAASAGWRDECDTERLFRYAELLAAEKEFFIRKAIGWALRDYAWHDGGRWRSSCARAKEVFGVTVREAGKFCDAA